MNYSDSLREYTDFVESSLRLHNSPGSENTFQHAFLLGAIGLGGEAGEVLELIKKFVYHGDELSSDALLLELGDTLWYLTLIASTAGFTLEDVIDANMKKLIARRESGRRG